MIVYILVIILIGIIGYLAGSLNFAIIFSKVMHHDDVRKHGSKNAGMTNVLRTFDIKTALFTMVGDFVKGLSAVLIGRLLTILLLNPSVIYISDIFAAFCALLGHVYPLYYNFKGGKGILVSAGAMVIIDWRVFLIVLLIFLIVFVSSRIISLGSIISAVSYPIVMFTVKYLSKTPTTEIIWLTIFAFLTAALIIYLHRGNIKRLVNHQEPKVFK